MRSWLAAILTAAALVLTACTGGSAIEGQPATGTSGAPATTGTAEPTGNTSAGRGPSAATARRVTAFHELWSWNPLGKDVDVLRKRLTGVVTTPHRIVLAAETGVALAGDAGGSSYLAGADPETRKVLWSHPLHGALEDLRVVGSTVVAEALATDRHLSTLVGIDPDSGRIRWRKQIAPDFAVDGTSLVVNTMTGGRAGVRFDADTGREQARGPARPDSILAASGDRVLLGDYRTLSALLPDLRHEAWHATAVAGAQVFVDDHTVVTLPPSALIKGSARLTGLDLADGHRTWSRTVPLSGELTDDPSQVDGLLVLHTARSATAVRMSDGAVAWKVTETGAAHFASSASTASNVIGCDKSLVSVSAGSGGLYGYADLSSDAFSLVGCITAPVALPGGRAGVLVADDTQVTAFATVARTAPPTKPDGLGRWGALTSNACEAPDTVHTLYALNHGTGEGRGWTLLKGGARTCTWHSPSSFPVAQTGVLASRSAAARYLRPGNSAGGCRYVGGHGGHESTVSLRGLALPAGSGACLLIDSHVHGKPANDLVTGVSRTRAGRWFYVALFYPYDEAQNFTGAKFLKRTLDLLAD